MNIVDALPKPIRRGLWMVIPLLLSVAAQAADTPAPKADKPAPKTAQQLQLETTTITGHHELPRVLYIVPWKRAETGDLPGMPPGSLLDEALQPLDRAEFRREMRYSDQLAAAADSATAPATTNQSTQAKSTGE